MRFTPRPGSISWRVESWFCIRKKRGRGTEESTPEKLARSSLTPDLVLETDPTSIVMRSGVSDSEFGQMLLTRTDPC